jgi:methylthioribose-1-phosphate isomerase
VETAFATAARICDEDAARNEAIGSHGRALFAPRDRPIQVLTHCNAGWLATVDWGTALAPIYKAHEDGVDVHVWVDETRPRNQGLLTAWELAAHGVPHTVIADNAGGHLMQHGRVDLCIVGTDRTTRDGDVCNKIGTYLKALAAHDNGVPFYVAVPSPSIDWTADARTIPIEERSGDEVRTLRGVELVPPTSAVANPAFDVTPRRLVTGLITERGIATPAELAAMFPEASR